jgi:hypothetical protein
VAAGYARIYGTEYETVPESSYNKKSVCAVCRVTQTSVMMIPVTNVCPAGWTRKYTGFIMADAADDGRSGTEYICVDSSMEGR